MYLMTFCLLAFLPASAVNCRSVAAAVACYRLSTEKQWNRLVVNLWSKMSLFCSMKEGISYLFLSATTYLLFCHVQLPPWSAIPYVCCRPSNGRKMQALTAVEWLTAVRYETDGRLANGWTDGLPENRLTGLGAGLPLTTRSPKKTDTPNHGNY